MKAELYDRLILPPKGARVLCAVSGGADSMCLLMLLRETGDYELAAAHFEHGIRGDESLRDCAFVEDWCREKDIACFIEHGDVPAFAEKEGLGLEEAGRKLRYAFLEKTAAEQGFDWIATAHNADDSAETMLFNLARGTGLAGLCGIPARRGKIIRPLLALTRKEIEQYLKESGTPYVEDSTNASDLYSRNRIRHTVIPALRDINGNFAESALRTAKLLKRDEECLEQLAEDFIESRFDGESLPAQELLALHEAVSSRIVRKLLPVSAEEKHISSVLSLCRSTERGFLDLPGVRLRCERGRLYFTEDEEEPVPEKALPIGAAVTLENTGITIRTQAAEGVGEIHSPFKTYRLKYESICGNLSVSSPRAGERYRPAGRGCTKALKSLFAEQRYTQREKRLTPVIRDEEGIVLVPPFGPAERCVCEPGEKAILITIENIEN